MQQEQQQQQQQQQQEHTEEDRAEEHPASTSTTGGSSLASTSSPRGFEFLDHPADVQIHAWGPSLKEAFEEAATAMFAYMTELETVEIQNQDSPCVVEAEGHDLESLLFSFLDEFLFVFASEYLLSKQVTIVEWDKENFRIKAEGRGEEFDLKKHPQGTEVKAITYSAMQVLDREEEGKPSELYVIVDI
ncbi:Protein archease [Balamuthia mandrillaris]